MGYVFINQNMYSNTDMALSYGVRKMEPTYHRDWACTVHWILYQLVITTTLIVVL
jgi:hypothetical protein